MAKVLTLHFTNPKSFTDCWSQLPEKAEVLGVDPFSVVALWRRLKCDRNGDGVFALDEALEKPDIIVPFEGDDDMAPIMLASWAVAEFKGTTKEIEEGEIPGWMLTSCSPVQSSQLKIASEEIQS